MRNYYKKGDYNAICDRCGFKFKASQMLKTWDGLFVDRTCWEPRQPQDFLRVYPEHLSVPIARPEPDDEFVTVCYLWDSSGYADLATADCARADNNTLSYSYLVSLKAGT